MEDGKMIVKMIFGSHLYGTATEDSDQDFKGVFLPTREQILLGRIPKSYNETTKKGSATKNRPDDVDTEIYSLHYFIELACQGQTVALDMLHAPDKILLACSPIWAAITLNRERFYTRNLKAFISYARRQAAKYGIKGSRLHAVSQVIQLLERLEVDEKLYKIWGQLPLGEHLYMVDNSPNGIRQYQVCGKIIQENTKVGHVLKILKRFADEYGKRAQMAANNEGIDWKSISHAFRAAYQVRQLLTERTITFPLKEAKFLTDIKQGKVDYTTQASPILESLMDEVEKLSEASGLPEKVDRKYWNRFIIDTLEREYSWMDEEIARNY